MNLEVTKHSLVIRQLSNGVAMQSQLLQFGQLCQLLDVTELTDLIGMQVQHLQLGKPGHILLNAAQLTLRQVQPAEFKLHTTDELSAGIFAVWLQQVSTASKCAAAQSWSASKLANCSLVVTHFVYTCIGDLTLGKHSRLLWFAQLNV